MSKFITLSGSASDVTITDGAADGKIGVRRIIWDGKVDDVERNTVLIVDNVNGGTLRGGWLIFGEEENHLTYYTDSAKLTAHSSGSIDDETAEISLQFVDKQTALTPRTFTFMEKYSLLSLGSSFDHVTIEASLRNDIYVSRTLKDSTKLNGVIKRGSKAKIDNNAWQFEDDNSFVAAAAKNNVPIFAPGLIDSMMGLQLWIFNQDHDFVVDAVADMHYLSDIVFDAEKVGAILLGGGLTKHYTLASNVIKGGLDAAIQITMDRPEAGSLGGAPLEEAKSWSKARCGSNLASVVGDVTVIFPLIYAATLDKLE